MANDFRWVLGTITKTALNATSTYALENFPRQSDQSDMMDWLEPTDFSDVLSEGAELVSALDNSRGFIGGYEFDWYLFLPSPGMVEYIRQTVFGGALSARFTVQTKDRASLTNQWVALWAWCDFPDLRKDAQPVGTGWQKVKFHFYDGVLAAIGGEFSYEFSYEFS